MATNEYAEVPPSAPIYQQYPLNLEVPFFSALLVGVVVFAILIKTTSKSLISRESQDDLPLNENQKERLPLNSARVGDQISGNDSQLEFYDWGNITKEAVGIIVAGNSGSAKTSLTTWLLGKLTQDNPCQILVLDPHANRNPLWGELGLLTINDFALIERQLERLEELLDNRRNQPDNGDTVIVVAEELGACIKNFTDSSRVQRTLERLGSEGRKYGLVLVSVNTSANSDDIGISAQSRNNFVTILCGAAARDFAFRKWKQTDQRQSWVNSQAYPCLVTGAVSPEIAIHPTHGHHEEFAITGKQPKNILPVNQLEVNIPTALESYSPTISEDAQKLLHWFSKKTTGEHHSFELRKIQQSRPLGKNSSHKLEVLTPLIDELVKAELLDKDENENYKLTETSIC